MLSVRSKVYRQTSLGSGRGWTREGGEAGGKVNSEGSKEIEKLRIGVVNLSVI